MSPIIRPRRLRKHAWIRDLVAETSISAKDLIYPIFITEGSGTQQEIQTMPGVLVHSIDTMLKEVEQAIKFGIRAVNIFPRVDDALKTAMAEEAINPDNLICRAARAIKENFQNEIGVICDVALDPYTNHGHDGLLNSAQTDVDNDSTVIALAKQSLVLAHSGVDFVSPSDMMDARVEAIRLELDANNFTDVGIISYAAKYASKLYGPFRDAVGSKTALKNGSKSSYQMDFRNHKEATKEIHLDIIESADIILIKPAIYSLDIIFSASSQFDIPIFAYQVSGEYFMIRSYAKELGLSFSEVMLESLICIKRAGAKSIFSYAALDVAKNLL
jgi:porphobilinogen synthase